MKTNKAPWSNLLNPFRADEKAQQEKARLESFIDAFPGEYCALNKDGSTVYSHGFCALIGAERIKNFADIQTRLTPGNSAALEGFYDRLVKHGTPFTLNAETIENKNITISGTRGQDSTKQKTTTMFWVQNITSPPATETETEETKTPEPPIATNELMQVQVALNSIPRPLWLRDTEQKIVWCNSTYAQYLDMNTQDIIREQKEIASQALKKKNTNDLTPGKELAQKALEAGEALESKAHAVFEGKRLLMKISEIPLTPLNMTLGIAYNITREEELETALKRHQSSNKELLEQLRSAIAIFNADQKLEFYNAAFAQLWDLQAGWLNKNPTLGEIMEKLRETRRLPEQSDFRRFKQSWLDMFTRLIEPHEDMLFLPDGSTYRMTAIPHSMGGLMMNFEDATGRLALESSYNTLIAVQKETLDNLAEGVAVFGGDGRLKLWNPAFANLWNLHPEALEGEPHISKVIEKMKPFFNENDWEQTKTTLMNTALERMMHENRFNRTDESLLEYSTVPLPDGGVLTNYADITDSVRVENALREKNAALETAERLKMDFLTNVSYQLRTPLNAMMGFAEILDQEYFGPLNTRQKEYTNDMQQAGQRLVSLIDDILDLSTLEAGYMQLQTEDIKIYTIMKSVHELMNDWARKDQVEIKLTCATNIGTLKADEKRLKQALINVIRNAINFAPTNSLIHLQASKSEKGITFTIQDNGAGIHQDDRKRIFEPFERAQSSKTRIKKEGAGLGLSLVKKIINLHNGTVELKSEKDKGTTIELFIPFHTIKTNLKLQTKKTA